MSSPVSRTERGVREHEVTGSFTAAVTDKIALVEALATSIPPSEFDRTVTLLAGRPKRIAICGGYFSRYLAMLFATQLDQAIPHVAFVAEPLGHDIGRLLGLTSGSVAIIIDFRRYELTSKQAADIAKQRGATVVVITDQGLSPAAETADIVLPVPVDGIPFDSFVGLMALLETLVEAVLAATEGEGIARMKEWEETVQIARAYRATALAEPAPGSSAPAPDPHPHPHPPTREPRRERPRRPGRRRHRHRPGHRGRDRRPSGGGRGDGAPRRPRRGRPQRHGRHRGVLRPGR